MENFTSHSDRPKQATCCFPRANVHKLHPKNVCRDANEEWVNPLERGCSHKSPAGWKKLDVANQRNRSAVLHSVV